MLYRQVFGTFSSEFRGILCVFVTGRGILLIYLKFAAWQLRKISEALLYALYTKVYLLGIGIV